MNLTTFDWMEKGAQVQNNIYFIPVHRHHHMHICIVKCIDGNDDDQKKKPSAQVKFCIGVAGLVVVCWHILLFPCLSPVFHYFLFFVCVRLVHFTALLFSVHCSPKCRIFRLQYETDGNDRALKVSGSFFCVHFRAKIHLYANELRAECRECGLYHRFRLRFRLL